MNKVFKSKKSDRTRQRIIDSAAYCLANFGEHGTTFQAIADHCHVSQPLVVQYLKNRKNIFEVVIQDLVDRARNQTEHSLINKNSAIDLLNDYLDVSLKIFSQDNIIPKIYLHLYYFSGISPHFKHLNSLIKKQAVERIYNILEQGKKNGEFRTQRDLFSMARLIHDGLIGILISSITEVSAPPTTKVLNDFKMFIMDGLKG